MCEDGLSSTLTGASSCGGLSMGRGSGEESGDTGSLSGLTVRWVWSGVPVSSEL